MLVYTKSDVGCYIDGACGHADTRLKLASLIEDLETQEMIDARGYSVTESLRMGSSFGDEVGSWPDDLGDELDALDILQNFTEGGLVWEFESGDLLLTEIEDDTERVRCNQCEALMINGLFCHETGCPNIHARYNDGDWIKTRECRECGCTVDADDQCCNAPFEEEDAQ